MNCAHVLIELGVKNLLSRALRMFAFKCFNKLHIPFNAPDLNDVIVDNECTFTGTVQTSLHIVTCIEKIKTEFVLV